MSIYLTKTSEIEAIFTPPRSGIPTHRKPTGTLLSP